MYRRTDIPTEEYLSRLGQLIAKANPHNYLDIAKRFWKLVPAQFKASKRTMPDLDNVYDVDKEICWSPVTKAKYVRDWGHNIIKICESLDYYGGVCYLPGDTHFEVVFNWKHRRYKINEFLDIALEGSKLYELYLTPFLSSEDEAILDKILEHIKEVILEKYNAKVNQ